MRGLTGLAWRVAMSLKFGLWLVEQGIVTCDQFCGLIKIQQESLPPSTTIVLRENVMTMRQVRTVNELVEGGAAGDFLDVAESCGFVVPKLASAIRQLQQIEAPSIASLAVQCGLMTAGQVQVLFRHFERLQAAPRTPAGESAAESSSQIPEGQSQNAGAAADAAGSFQPHPVPEPKFRQRPVIVHQYDVTY